jgi:hypothetical protein
VLFAVNALSRIATVLALAAFAGCSLFVTVPNLSDGPIAGPDGSTAPTGDAATPVSGDAGGGASDAGDGGLCTGLGTDLFCDGFDGTPPFGRWDQLVVGPGRTVVTDTLFNPPSSPNALFATIDGTVTDDCAYARVEKQIQAKFNRVRLSFSFRIEGPPPSLVNEAIARQSIDGDASDGCQMLTNLSWNGASYDLVFSEQVVNGTQVTSMDHPAGTVPPQAWQRLTIDVTYGGKLITVHDGDGRERLREALNTTCPYYPNPATAALGFHCSQRKSATRQVRIDDVVFDPIRP